LYYDQVVDVKKRNQASQMRHQQLQTELEKNPFLSDDQLATRLNVSIHTVRADRRRVGIPEVRKRGSVAASGLFAHARTLSRQEIVGELLEINLDRDGLSLLDTTAEMGLEKSGIIRGHVVFSQANTLANAIVDAEVALTSEAQVRFMAPVYAGERLLAKARVIGGKRHRKQVEVIMKTKQKIVFEGLFTIYCLTERLAAHFRVDNRERKDGGESGEIPAKKGEKR